MQPGMQSATPVVLVERGQRVEPGSGKVSMWTSLGGILFRPLKSTLSSVRPECQSLPEAS